MDSIRTAVAASTSMDAGIAHGGRLIEARRRYPQAPEPFLDLSTGINPHPYPIGTLDPAVFARLPEPEDLAALQQAAARAYGAADPAMVVAAPGTQILISLLPRLLGLSRACILGPTYGEHAAAWSAAGASVTLVRSLDGLRQARPGAAILCNPNNPDGRMIDAAALRRLAADLAGCGGVLIVDEAFADLEVPDPGLAAALPLDGLLILRSFGKCYGLAGLRLGFLLANPARAGRLRTALGPWPVCGPALAVGRVALADAAWREAARTGLQRDGARLDALMATSGFTTAGGTTLFRLFRGTQAAIVADRLARSGILVRRFDHDPDLLRLGLPGDELAWSRLGEAMAADLSHS